MTSALQALEGLPRTCLSILGAALIALSLGLVLGTLSARRAGVYDDLLRRLVEFSGALPLIVAIPLLGRVWPVALGTAAVLGVHEGLRLACVFRNEMQRVRHENFVLALRAIGVRESDAERRHVLPFVLAPLYVALLMVPAKVLSIEAALAYLELDSGASFGGGLARGAGPAGLVPVAILLVILYGLHRVAERTFARILRSKVPALADASCEARGSE
jgi:ABC-type dipeptide/oligopeptide/nickel transport system permease subunit